MMDFQIPGYEILNLIGEGAMSRVYTARQLSLQRVVAIKVLHREKIDCPTVRAQFKLEANATAALKHPNILQVYEAGESQGLPYFVMEHAAAYSVESWVQRKGHLLESDVLTIADFTARALKYAWDRSGLIHCDLKPGNLLVDEEGLIKVADFSGLSRFSTSPEADLLKDVTIGTPNYMSPEQVRGLSPLDFRADIYGLGALMHHLLTGSIPFGDCSPEKAMRQQVEGYLPDVSEANHEISLPTILLVERLLVKNRESRYGSWDEVLADIARIHSGRGPESPLPAAGASTMRRTTPLLRMDSPQGPPPFAPPPLLKDPLGQGSRRKSLLRAARIAALLGIAGGLALVDLTLIRKKLQDRETPIQPLGPSLPLSPPPALEGAEPSTSPSPETDATAGAESALVPDTVDWPPAELPATGLESAEAETEEDAEAAQAEADRIAFFSYLDLVKDLSALSRKRDWASAVRTAEAWLEAHSESPQAGRVRSHIALLTEAARILPFLLDQDTALRGAGVHLPQGLPAEVVGTRQEHLLVRRKLEGGFAESEIDLAQLSVTDLLTLLKKADADGFARRAGVLYLALCDLNAANAALARPGALPPDAQDLPTWNLDWSSGLLNQAARAALEDIRGLIVKSEFTEAARRMDAAKKAYRETEIFTLYFREEVEELEIVITAEQEAGDAAEQDKPGATPPAPSPSGTAEDAPSEIQSIGIREFNNNRAQLSGQYVRLAFTYRGSIQAADSGGYTVEVYSPEGIARVQFGDEGFQWMNSQPQWATVRGRERFVYGRITEEAGALVLLGRTRRARMGGRGVQFSW
jgi:serine/threonine-protein kinase